jgi:DNA invertase Pin-like site-specific DNA recombinase
MKKAVIYGRVSTEDKQDYGRQVADLERYAKKNDYKIVAQFTEKVSGAKRGEDRVEYSRMMEYITANNIDNILVTELSRFGRMGVKTRSAIEDLAEKKINIFFMDRGLNSLQKDGSINSDTMMLIGILSDIAKKELETLKIRIKSGLRYSASNNGAMSGKYKAYGFKSVNGKLVVNEPEKKIIQEIFNLSRNGLGAVQICKHLNNKGVATRYNQVIGDNMQKIRGGGMKKGTDFGWAQGTITRILRNRLYRGERLHAGELVSNIEPLVDPKLFDQVQVILTKRNNTPIRTMINDNHLKGIIKCGVCGLPYFMHKRKDNSDNAYKCISFKDKYVGKISYCKSPPANIDKLLNSLFIVTNNIIIDTLKGDKSTYLNEINTKIKIKEIEIANLTKEIKRFNGKLKSLYEDYNDRIMTKAIYITNQREYQNKLDQATSQLATTTEQLIQLNEAKKKPVRDFYTKQVFLREIRSVISMIKIAPGIPTKANKIDHVFKESDSPVSVTVEAVNGQSVQYILGRYSKKVLLLENNKYKVVFTMQQNPIFGDLMEIAKKKLV